MVTFRKEDSRRARYLYSHFDDLIGVHGMAKAYKMHNVLQFCDWYLVTRNKREYNNEEVRDWIISASMFEFRHLLVYLLKPMKSVKDCIDEEDVEYMTNESMKMFIAKFLYEKF
ncbi:hypothetical protein CAEBREN_01553 [Caenorhabditis brenneri]|uniref:Uncharacterized protein n=1 Tax=Caenorhabditis brenneri TaxID=135651 RepID=G0NIU6_CAEBE|nr:hypothetical protein CAEBREN_01553 [Caenorhabditis brenneri]